MAELLIGAGAAIAAAASTAAAAVGTAATAIGTAIAAASTSSLLTAASLAWTIGSSIYSWVSGPSSTIQGPRVKDLFPQSAALGAPAKRFWGVDRMAGQLVWVGSNGKGGRGVREHKHTDGGKGGGSGMETYSYEADFAISVNMASNCAGVIRIWQGTRLIYDVSEDASLQSRIGTGIKLGGRSHVTFYNGAEDQQVPAPIAALAGEGNSPAYRNQFIVLFEHYDCTDNGGQIPQFSFECFTDGLEEFKSVERYATADIFSGATTAPEASWSYVSPQGEIIFMLGAKSSFYQSIFPPGNPLEGEYMIQWFQLLNDGSIIPMERPFNLWPSTVDGKAYGGNFVLGHSDEPLSMTTPIGGYVLWRPSLAPVLCLPPDSSVFNHAYFATGTRFSKKGNRVAILTGLSQDVVLHDAGIGNFLAGSHAFNYTAWNIVDIMHGDEFLWLLHAKFIGIAGPSTNHLLKLDPETLDLVEDIDLGVNKFVNFFVQSDNVIKLVGQNGFSMEFWEYRDGVLDQLGTDPSPGTTGLGGILWFRNGVWYTAKNDIGGLDPTVYTWGPGVSGNCVPMKDIVRDICISCGLEEDEIDAEELTDCVRGYTLETMITGRDAIMPLQRYGFFDGRESDLQLQFIKRGHDPVATIPERDMAARPGLDAQLPPLMDMMRAQETELPWRVHVKFKDQDASYQPNHAYAQSLTTEAVNEFAIDVPIVMTADKAKQIADVLEANFRLERTPREIKVSRKYLPLDAADPVALEIAA